MSAAPDRRAHGLRRDARLPHILRVGIAVLLVVASTTAAFADGDALPPPVARPTTSAWHIGVMTPIVTRARGELITPPDSLMTMIPFGVLVMRGPLMFDTELMPMITSGPQAVDLTIAPGFIYALSPDIYVGARSALELKSGRVGVTPLFHYNLRRFEHTYLFTEIVLPVRVAEDASGNRFTTVGLAIALGALFQ